MSVQSNNVKAGANFIHTALSALSPQQQLQGGIITHRQIRLRVPSSGHFEVRLFCERVLHLLWNILHSNITFTKQLLLKVVLKMNKGTRYFCTNREISPTFAEKVNGFSSVIKIQFILCFRDLQCFAKREPPTLNIYGTQMQHTLLKQYLKNNVFAKL